MAEDRLNRFVSRGFKGVSVIRGGGSGPPLLAGRSAGGTARKQSANLLAKVRVSPELQEIVGREPLARSQVVKRVWEHIRLNNLQNPLNKREIVPDAKLGKVIGKGRVSMFEMNKHLRRHIGKGTGEDVERRRKA